MQATLTKLSPELNAEGIAAVSDDIYTDLECSVGDAVSVSVGDRDLLLRLTRTDGENEGIVALGRPDRNALSLAPGATVYITPVPATPASRVTVRIPPSLSDTSAAYQELREALLGRPVYASKNVLVGIDAIDRNTGVANVVGTFPGSVVTITAETTLEFVAHNDGPGAPYSTDRDDHEVVYEYQPDTGGDRYSSETTDEDDEPASGDDSRSYAGTNEFRLTDDEIADVTYDDIGGLDDIIEQFREVTELPFAFPELKSFLGDDQSTGILLRGPPGTGKTLLAKTLANETDAAFYRIDGPEVMSKWYGEAERRLRDLFDAARANAPSIIYFDELDSLGQVRTASPTDTTERRVVGQLLSVMDGLEENDDVIVIGSTNNAEQIDPALRRPGRLGATIEVGPPSAEGREEIFGVHTRDVPLADDVDLEAIAARTHGYTGADIEAVVDAAQQQAFSRHLDDANLDVTYLLDTEWSGRDREQIIDWFDRCEVTAGDIETALETVEPSGLVDHRVTVPETNWDDIGGLEDVKHQLYEAAVLPTEYADSFDAMDISPRAGVLLAGPPGTGKTMLANAVATEAEANFMLVNGPELLGGAVGSAEAEVREVFETARETGPTVLFFDEFDSLVPERGTTGPVGERVVSQFLTELDGVTDRGDVTVIAATNRPDRIDDAVLRDGRLGDPVTVGLPDLTARWKILEIHTEEKPLAGDVALDTIAKETDGVSGSTLAAICDCAATIALEEAINTDSLEAESAVPTTIEMRHFEEAVMELTGESDSSSTGGFASAD
ncbi:AAA family ATPase [Natronorubrum sp. JWXQ-INN-674]|uniref:AAA family ATPase n=1 Tax=Natronorubrum halalkaliphilum TaxID=2691917 RepID=A0A6B0VL92_9EURY|nr:AAA family ATPase [Natronorubrum halalkaliphilum]MXV61877.1 AAA family ATPase [Natronorubrum halalkaliphilum]